RRRDGRDVRRQVGGVRLAEVGEGEVGQRDLLAGAAQGEGQRKPGVDVEAAAGPRDQDAVVSGEPGEERWLRQREVHRSPRSSVELMSWRPSTGLKRSLDPPGIGASATVVQRPSTRLPTT